jgi:membrane-bound lytic murein transglycosylase MltF
MKEKIFLHRLYRIMPILVIGVVTYLLGSVNLPPQTAIASPLAEAEDDLQQGRGLFFENESWTGDFDQMLENRKIRVLLPHSPTLYFNDKGQERGVTGDTVRDFERYLNKKYAKKLGRRPLTIFIIPCTRDRLLADVVSGSGDIAAGDITVTPERQKTVKFVAPVELPVESEVLVTRTTSPDVSDISDLSGKTIHVRQTTSYYESLTALNDRFKQENKKPVTIVLVPDALEDEDLMEMLNAGIFEYLIIDDWIAKIWADVLPDIRIRKDIVLRSGAVNGWAVRKDSPKLEAEIRDFCKGYLNRHGIIASRLTQYHKRIVKIKNPTNTPEWKRFEKTIALFKKYGGQYGFDPVMLAAQGYQESGLNQNKRSRSGAIGIMQIMPGTGKSLKVGDIKLIEPNIHAGAKYMNMLMTDYFADAKFSEQDRSLFAFASYNAGPGRISSLRKIAGTRGLDPNQWFNNVELIAAQKIGFQTTTYVRNIYKYYVAYKLTFKVQDQKRKVRDQLAADQGQ